MSGVVAPVRVQLSRQKGWRMPANTVKVDRTTKDGNPWKIGGRDHNNDLIENNADAASAFASWVDDMIDAELQGWSMRPLDDWRERLRGKNLACWCRLDQPCHADALLKAANR